MNTRRVMTWVIFWSSVVLALAALAWVTIEVIALEKREAAAHVEASRQESIRRALWRMDSRMTPILAIEASRPYTDYQSLDTAQDLIAQDNKDIQSELNLPFNAGLSYANSYFEIAQPGDSPPQLEQQIQLKLSTNWDAEQSTTAKPNKGKDEGKIEAMGQIASLDQAASEPTGSFEQTDSDFEARKRVAKIATQSTQSDARGYNYVEPTDRVEMKSTPDESVLGLSRENAPEAPADEQLLFDAPASQASTNLEPATLKPRWVEDDRGAKQLVLVRSVNVDGKRVVQGVWLDWESLRNDLLASVDDVIPGSSLVPVEQWGMQLSGVYQLATIPVAFIPGEITLSTHWRWSPATVGLLVTWIAILSTIIAVGVVLRAAIVLSERRGRFVSAVTHELRTPLTTFRLYSQMLADGMVSDEEVRKDYLSILKRESERLTGIVENVLEYARLTRQRSSKSKPAGVQTLSPGALIARFRPALARRAGQSNMDLVVSMDLGAHQDRTLTVDPHAVERIMMNLVENACKYAAPSEDDEVAMDEVDTRIHLDVTVAGDTLEFLVADHGPGIKPGEGAQIFGEFQRGWRGLSNARSGLGLGLALSRGLAREMEGDLVLTKRRGHGAEFLLTIKLDELQIESGD